MYRFVSIHIKKNRTSTKKLGFSRWERLRFFLGFPVVYKGCVITSLRGRRNVFLNLMPPKDVLMPDFPPEVIDSVEYEHDGFSPEYPNGYGYIGETLVQTRTLDGKQFLLVQGKTTTGVTEALVRFQSGETPSFWVEESAKRTIPTKRVRVSHYHHNDTDSFGLW